MNSIWNKNIRLFMARFPELAKIFSLEKETDIPEDIPENLRAPIEILPSKQNIPTAKDNGKFLHSSYNPLKEAEQAALAAKSSVKNGECRGCAFFSAGLGYTAFSYARLFPEDTIILIENDPRYFFTALSLVDWSDIFFHKNCIVALGTGIDFAVTLIENTSGLKNTAIYENTAQSAHSAEYFSALRSLLERNIRKVEINESTREKFSKLWIRNSCKNLHHLFDLEGISIFKNKCPPDIYCLILAAGPTLQEILPDLAEIKKNAVLICVDTALRAVLKTGVEPDFIVLTDPQYYAYRHIAGLSSPSSILITESAAYPAVFRFNCKKIVLISSLFPLGQYIESKIGKKGSLVPGGSVSTTAWEFARFIGAKKIYCAGLDLGYPDFQTHIKGSAFEENIHTVSNRLSTAEFLGSRILFGSDIQKAKSYDGNEILTDSKMKMFAWWFESKQEEFKDSVKTFSLSEKSLAIPGFETARKLETGGVTGVCFERISTKAAPRPHSTAIVISALKTGLYELSEILKDAIKIAEKGINSKNPEKEILEIKKIDAEIKKAEFYKIISLCYPSEKKLCEELKKNPLSQDKDKIFLQKSKIVYEELANGIKLHQKYLF